MEDKTIILITTGIGGIIGGYIPTLWSDSSFSIMSLLLSAVGGFLGIYVGYKIVNN